jgi:hypothetical protein
MIDTAFVNDISFCNYTADVAGLVAHHTVHLEQSITLNAQAACSSETSKQTLYYVMP